MAEIEDVMMRSQALTLQNTRMREALENIANNVRWGIQYRYIARDALEFDTSIDLEFPQGMAFDKHGVPVQDYGPEHDPELPKRIGTNENTEHS